MTEQRKTDLRDAQQNLIRKSMEDEQFRQELLADPKTALERELGSPLPVNVEVVVLENEADKVHLVLPPRTLAGRELSEEELDVLAGGGGVPGGPPLEAP
jgi:hypothetical protein